MVHRPTDARLLTNLIAQEKDHSKHFYAFLDAANTSVSSLSAYAAASAPPASQIILKVSASLASADDALRRYAFSLDEWREQLKALKTLEDEVTNIIRDREIHVTRVLKASKQKQSTGGLQRSSQHPSSSSIATSKSEFSIRASINGYSKLTHAQSELQACEAHLAAKERELAIRRCAIVKAGLEDRFRAMVNCGWIWGQIGKEALATLEQLSGLIDEQSRRPALTPAPSATNNQLLGPSSDLSSISPSQSASQINILLPAPKLHLDSLHSPASDPTLVGQPPRSQSPALLLEAGNATYTTMSIPPAHAIADTDMPLAVTNHHLPSPPPSNVSHDIFPVPSASIISVKSLPVSHSEHLQAGFYSGEERVFRTRRHVLSRRITEEELDEQHRSLSSCGLNESSSDDNHCDDPLTVVDNPRFVKSGNKGRQYNTEKPLAKRERRGSLFGSLRGFFFGKRQNKWDMRTEDYLRKRDIDDRRMSTARFNSPPRSRRVSDATGSRSSLKFLNGNIVTSEGATLAGSDNESGRRKLRRGTRPMTRKRSSSVPPVAPVAGASRGAEDFTVEPKQRPSSGILTVTGQSLHHSPSPTGALSRSSSIASAASAPVVSKSAGVKPALNGRALVERRMSLGGKSMEKKNGIMPGQIMPGSHLVGSGDVRRGVVHFNPNGATADTSLMSIVEDVARANRDATEKLKDKKNLSMANLIPGQHASVESAISPGSSTMTLLPGPGHSIPIRSSSPLRPTEPMIFIPKAPLSLGKRELEAWEKDGQLATKWRGNGQPESELGLSTVSRGNFPTSTPEKQGGSRQGRTSLDASMPGSGGPRRPAQSPLRSALRNPNSRSASPARPMDNGTISASKMSDTVLPGDPDGQERKKGRARDNSDGDSISSYETGREVPLDDNSFSADGKLEVNGEARMSEPGAPNGVPQRRKSVRVSLQPTFSPTPPAIYVDEDEVSAKPLWGGKQTNQESDLKVNGWSKRRNADTSPDLWENSSDEDEEYMNAKKLLNRLSTTASNPRKG
ncbi:hypothetical protein APHAL10511_003039 [Amanita phalloides]|nr:hypothetical protein APHAL10511_003039 [Amanita phalloides]